MTVKMSDRCGKQLRFKLLTVYGLLASVVALANAVFKGTAVADGLRLLSIAPERRAHGIAQRLALRSGPLPESGGAEFGYGGGTTGPGSPFEFLVDGLADAARFRHAYDGVIYPAAEARAGARAEASIGSHGLTFAAVNVTRVGVTIGRASSDGPAVVAIRTLDEDQTPEGDGFRGTAMSTLARVFELAARRHASLAWTLASLAMNMARRSAGVVAAAGGLATTEATGHPRHRHETALDLHRLQPDDLRWKKGVAVAGLRGSVAEATLVNGQLAFPDRLPDKAIVDACPADGGIALHLAVPTTALVTEPPLAETGGRGVVSSRARGRVEDRRQRLPGRLDGKFPSVPNAPAGAGGSRGGRNADVWTSLRESRHPKFGGPRMYETAPNGRELTN